MDIRIKGLDSQGNPKKIKLGWHDIPNELSNW